MSKSLVIVESPSKAKTINKYLGRDFKVIASVGHIKDLPKKGLGVDVETNFNPTFEVMPSKEKLDRTHNKSCMSADPLYAATHPTREGETIVKHITELITGTRGMARKPIFRVMFNEITKNAVKDAFNHPGKINDNLVDAQQ